MSEHADAVGGNPGLEGDPVAALLHEAERRNDGSVFTGVGERFPRGTASARQKYPETRLAVFGTNARLDERFRERIAHFGHAPREIDPSAIRKRSGVSNEAPRGSGG